MKFKTARYELDEDQFGLTELDEKLWIVLPQGVKEGFVHSLTSSKVEGEEGTRASNWQILGLIRAWNLDDSQGEVLPLPSSLVETHFQDDVLDEANPAARRTSGQKFIEERNRILSEVPLALFEFIAEKAVNRRALTERVEGF